MEQNGRIGGILISFPKEISNSLSETIWSKGRTAQGTEDSCLDIRIRIYALDSMTKLYTFRRKKPQKYYKGTKAMQTENFSLHKGSSHQPHIPLSSRIHRRETVG